jgi:hypothetical protein
MIRIRRRHTFRACALLLLPDADPGKMPLFVLLWPGPSSRRVAPAMVSDRPFRAEGGEMLTEKLPRRMTLRQLLTHSEKCSRDLIEHINGSFVPRVSDFRDLSRPIRRKSHYPALIAVINAMGQLEQTTKELDGMAEHLYEQLETIRDHAQREKINRR